MLKIRRFFLFLFLFNVNLQTPFASENEIISYHSISQDEPFPENLAKQAKKMLYDAYDPNLHKGLTIADMGLKNVASYEEFLEKLLQDDLSQYKNHLSRKIIFYACNGPSTPNYTNLVGFCSLLPQNQKGHYYLDHIGIKSDCQRRGIGSSLINLLVTHLKDITLLSLDTRVFNTISQPFYVKLGFLLMTPHPDPQKDSIYLRYERRFNLKG